MIRRQWMALGMMACTLGLFAAPGEAASKLRVVTTITDLKALTEAVGGNLVEVESLARGNQDPHNVDLRPSLMLKVRRADLIVMVGLELEPWVEGMIMGSNNGNLAPGGPGRVVVSQGIPVMELPQVQVDRSMGDVHPFGNPHFTLDPGLAPIITSNILQGLARLAPEQRTIFEKNRQEFLDRLAAAQSQWTKVLEPYRGSKIVVFHSTSIYFLTRFGLVQAATVEDRPGIPPSPAHLAAVIRLMKDQRIKVILIDPWLDRAIAERAAEEAGARVVVQAGLVGAVKSTDDSYFETIAYNVNALAQALK
ncbi:MAG TPA: metal ABC transporter substrate-binding protein [Candidatus Sulfotelmatobacter sp.]|nr:metal ABC transporter substrate-binding protein [Candidatus Sulfotelmatobacter sp.]